jgi:glycosyltransferase involved in cell wall biosynthesis
MHYWYETKQEARALESADGIVVVTPTMRSLLCRRYPHLAGRIHVISNGFDPDDFSGQPVTPPGDRLRIGFSGGITDYSANPGGVKVGLLGRFWLRHCSYRLGRTDFTTQSPYYLFRAVRALLDEQPDARQRILLTFAGKPSDENRALVRELGIEDLVLFPGYLPHPEAIRLLIESDVLFLPMRCEADGRRSYIYSGKVFEYLAAGRPILAAVPDGDLRDLICQTRGGWCVEPHDIQGMKTLLKEFLERKVAGSLQVDRDEGAVRQFERSVLTEKLAGVFDAVLARRTQPGQSSTVGG